MCRFIESIYVKDGKSPLLAYHQHRYELCLKVHFPNAKPLQLKEFLKFTPKDNRVYKLRIQYASEIEKYEFQAYSKPNIQELVIVNDDKISYEWKNANRTALNQLKSGLNSHQEIIIVKSGYITDSSFSNLVFEKSGYLHTPETPLLAGVQRENLLNQGIITPKKINLKTVHEYENIYLINALLSIEQGIKLPTSCLIR
jgi:4-amino-4-deoxychorismate lyase